MVTAHKGISAPSVDIQPGRPCDKDVVAGAKDVVNPLYPLLPPVELVKLIEHEQPCVAGPPLPEYVLAIFIKIPVEIPS